MILGCLGNRPALGFGKRLRSMRKKAARSSAPCKIRNFDSCPRSLLKPSVRKLPKILWRDVFVIEQTMRKPLYTGAKGDQQVPMRLRESWVKTPQKAVGNLESMA